MHTQFNGGLQPPGPFWLWRLVVWRISTTRLPEPAPVAAYPVSATLHMPLGLAWRFQSGNAPEPHRAFCPEGTGRRISSSSPPSVPLTHATDWMFCPKMDKKKDGAGRMGIELIICIRSTVFKHIFLMVQKHSYILRLYVFLKCHWF